MRILSTDFIDAFSANTNKILNIHPALLPKYKGLNTHQRAIDAGTPILSALSIIDCRFEPEPEIKTTILDNDLCTVIFNDFTNQPSLFMP
jgi:hypothetical protein